MFGAGVCITASCTLTQGDRTSPAVGSVGGGVIDLAGGPPGSGGSEVACVSNSTQTPVFAEQAFGSKLLFGREFYTWVTAEQALALRSARNLFSEPAGSDPALGSLNALDSPSLDESMLAQRLLGSFKDGRYAWPEPWAIRLGGGRPSASAQLVRVVLEPEAWLALVAFGHLFVFDAQKQSVKPADALAHPENIGVFYFDSALQNPGICGIGTSGQREFLLGNLAMVQEWSIGTQQIADRIETNTDELTRFLNNSRSCPVTSDASAWVQSVLCVWVDQVTSSLGAAGATSFDSGAGGAPSNANGAAAGFNSGLAGASAVVDAGTVSFDPTRLRGFVGPSTEEAAYEQALAIPSASYLGAPAQIATIIQTLQGDLFELDPLVVTPGSP